eukprot:gb/GEZN01023588.1/.p1 GENE.gb/GEZN01023588.1/~~gb/GEZN01023588.1/.p1  ORF type:complete len:117 (+),score=8.44 gb/GEZN01023588.1/:56-406(+)
MSRVAQSARLALRQRSLGPLGAKAFASHGGPKSFWEQIVGPPLGEHKIVEMEGRWCGELPNAPKRLHNTVFGWMYTSAFVFFIYIDLHWTDHNIFIWAREENLEHGYDAAQAKLWK